MKSHINNYLEKLKKAVDNLDRNEIEAFINVLLQARERDNTVFIMGNGGSAAIASHFCCDFNKEACGFRFICLNDNIPTIMALANDISYDDIFVEQLKKFYRAGDVVVGISGSGNSKNVLKAVEYANLAGGITVGLSGFDGGALRQIARYSVNTNINNMQITEDLILVLDHLIMSILCETQKRTC